jgi:Ca2+-binding EF-hand superfamily protein
VDNEILRNIFQNLGFGDISDEDLDILVETGDGDKDGKISLADFRNMLPMSGEAGGAEEKPAAAAPEKPKEAEEEAA